MFPILGTLAYLLYLNVRPPRETREEESSADSRELQVLSDLHDRGRLTDEEFAAETKRALASGGVRSGG